MARVRGISLIELSIVVAILGVIALVVLPNLTASSVQRLDLASQRVVDALRFARSEALRTGQLTGVVVDTGNTLGVFKDLAVFVPDPSGSPFALDRFVDHPLSGHPYDQRLETSVGGPGVAFSGPAKPFTYDGITDGRDYVFFDATGAPVWLEDGNRFRLVGGTLDLALGRLKQRITVEPVTGKVQLQ